MEVYNLTNTYPLSDSIHRIRQGKPRKRASSTRGFAVNQSEVRERKRHAEFEYHNGSGLRIDGLQDPTGCAMSLMLTPKGSFSCACEGRHLSASTPRLTKRDRER